MNTPAPIPPAAAYFSNLAREHGFEEVEVEGALPPGLSGTLYRNGPGIMEQFGRIDPETLAVIGETDLGGAVAGAFSAHPHRVEARRCLYNFGLSYGKQTTLDLYALPDEGAARRLGGVALPRAVMLHDFAATERHLVFFVSPLRVVLWRMLLALRPFQRCFAWTPADGAEVIVVPIDAPDEVTRFRVDPFLQFHFAGAREEGGEILVDYVRYEDASLLWALGDGMGLTFDASLEIAGGRLHRARIDPHRRTFQSELLWGGDCEFPRYGPGPVGRRPLWMQSEVSEGGSLHHRITRRGEGGGLRHHRLGRGQLCSEPVPAGASVLSLVFDSPRGRSHLLVLDADTLAVQARVHLSQAIPLTFHGSWLPAG